MVGTYCVGPSTRLLTGRRPRYTAAMSRFVPGQPDLFAPSAAAPRAAGPRTAAAGGTGGNAGRAACHGALPWPNLNVAMAEEQHFLGLARMAGAEGQILAAAIMDESERLFAAGEQAAARVYAGS